GRPILRPAFVLKQRLGLRRGSCPGRRLKERLQGSIRRAHAIAAAATAPAAPSVEGAASPASSAQSAKIPRATAPDPKGSWECKRRMAALPYKLSRVIVATRLQPRSYDLPNFPNVTMRGKVSSRVIHFRPHLDRRVSFYSHSFGLR